MCTNYLFLCSFFYIRLGWDPGALCSALRAPKRFQEVCDNTGDACQSISGSSGAPASPDDFAKRSEPDNSARDISTEAAISARAGVLSGKVLILTHNEIFDES